jgi:hypothetical protein
MIAFAGTKEKSGQPVAPLPCEKSASRNGSAFFASTASRSLSAFLHPFGAFFKPAFYDTRPTLHLVPDFEQPSALYRDKISAIAQVPEPLNSLKNLLKRTCWSQHNFQQHVSSIRQLKNKLFTDETSMFIANTNTDEYSHASSIRP